METAARTLSNQGVSLQWQGMEANYSRRRNIAYIAGSAVLRIAFSATQFNVEMRMIQSPFGGTGRRELC